MRILSNKFNLFWSIGFKNKNKMRGLGYLKMKSCALFQGYILELLKNWWHFKNIVLKKQMARKSLSSVDATSHRKYKCSNYDPEPQSGSYFNMEKIFPKTISLERLKPVLKHLQVMLIISDISTCLKYFGYAVTNLNKIKLDL